jgi:hypothetical protein
MPRSWFISTRQGAGTQQSTNTMVSRAEIDELKKLINASTVKRGVGYKVRRSGGGTVLDILPGKGGASSAVIRFKITLEPVPVSEGQELGDNGYQCYVGEGSLFNTLRPNDALTIDGLTLTDDTSPTYFPVIPTDAVYLETTYDDAGEVLTTEVKTWGDGGAFDPTAEAWQENAYVELDINSEFQEKSRILLGYTLPGLTGAPELTQVTKTDLLLRECVIDGSAARYPMAHAGTYFLEEEAPPV